jgi:hypothetical protein
MLGVLGVVGKLGENLFLNLGKLERDSLEIWSVLCRGPKNGTIIPN